MIVVVVLLVIAVSTYVKQQIAKDRELEINESLLGKAMDLNYKQTGLRKGDTPPDFTLTTMDGKEVTLSDYKGKKVILNFWASWCPPCKAEMPHMQKYYDKKAEEQNFEILAVNLTSEEKSNRLIEKFLQSYGITFPVPLDEKGNIALKYQVITIPSTFILNTDGQIEHSIIGPMNEDLLETYVEGIN